MSRTRRLALIVGALTWGTGALGGCVQASQIYPLTLRWPGAGAATGSIQVERIEGEDRLFVLKLTELPPPEQLSPGAHAFVVWLREPRGGKAKVGPLRYDRAARTGDLMGTTPFSSFTVQVTAERDAEPSAPSQLVLAERTVTNH